jgi:hypothetical protein
MPLSCSCSTKEQRPSDLLPSYVFIWNRHQIQEFIDIAPIVSFTIVLGTSDPNSPFVRQVFGCSCGCGRSDREDGEVVSGSSRLGWF